MCEVKRTWPDLTYCHSVNLEGQKKTMIDVSQCSGSRRRYVVKHNLITEVYLMNVMENNYMFRPVLAIIRLSMELKG